MALFLYWTKEQKGEKIDLQIFCCLCNILYNTSCDYTTPNDGHNEMKKHQIIGKLSKAKQAHVKNVLWAKSTQGASVEDTYYNRRYSKYDTKCSKNADDDLEQSWRCPSESLFYKYGNSIYLISFSN